MTSPHLAESLRKYSAKASSGPGTGCTAKRSRYFFWNSGSLMILCASALTFLMMSAGAPAAANSPNDTTVVLGPRHGLCRDRISGTAPVFDADALLPHLRQPLCNGARKHVGQRAGGRAKHAVFTQCCDFPST